MRLAFCSVIFAFGFSVFGANASECIDTGEQGDGWGWDGAQSCRIAIPAGECVDYDGDGWGWDGVQSCLTDVVAPNSSPDNYQILPTGQTTSYSIGDDGDWQVNTNKSARFQNNANGTFTDSKTGLTWLGVRDCIVEHNWYAAVSFANQLGAGVNSCAPLNDGSVAGDWRLPNVTELQSLVDYSLQSPAFAPGIPFSGTWDSFPWGRYWSSTSFVADPTNNAWGLQVGFGQSEIRDKTLVARAWAVRD